MPIRVAVVILNYNGKKYLEQYLPSVCRYLPTYAEIIVADNGSTDDSLVFLRQRFPQISTIELGKNLGFAEGYNQALHNLEHEYFLLLNSDVEIRSCWIEPLVQMADTDRSIGAIQPKIKSLTTPEMFEYAGAAGGFIDKYGYPLARGRIFNTVEQDSGQYDDDIPIFWASGAAMFVRKEAWRKAGGLDGYFFAHQEEIDLCWRMQNAGYTIRYNHNAVVYHLGGGTLPQGSYKKTYLNFRNNLILLSKNLLPKEKWSILFIRMLLDGIFAVKSLCTLDLLSFKAVFSAHMGFYKWLFSKNTKRCTVNPVQPFLRLNGTIPSSVVWNYYIKKKKKFSEYM